jgi:DNA-3-methyladenine glycosylase
MPTSGAGPRRLTQALGVDITLNGASLDQPPFYLEKRNAIAETAEGGRIGITQGVETLWRSDWLDRRISAARVP